MEEGKIIILQNKVSLFVISVGLFIIVCLFFSLTANAETIFAEDFETWGLDSNGDNAPVGWEIDVSSYSYFQGVPIFWCEDSITPFGHCALCYHNGNYPYTQNEWLITPELDLSNYTNTSLTFWTHSFGAEASMTDHNYIKVWESGSWTTISDLCNDMNSNIWASPITMNLSNFDREIIKIAFHKKHSYHYWIHIGRWSVDNLTINADFEPDIQSPETTIIISDPKVDDGQGGQYITSKTNISFTVTDPGGSGVNYTEYKIWYLGSWSGPYIYTGTFNLTGECVHYLHYKSVDNAGNFESWKNHTFHVDNTAPVSWMVIGEPHWGNYVTKDTVITIYAIDLGPCSVLNATPPVINYSLDGGITWVSVNLSWDLYFGWYITFNFNCSCNFTWYCFDCLGNGGGFGDGGINYIEWDFIVVADIDPFTQIDGDWYIDNDGGVHVTNNSKFEIGEDWSPFSGSNYFRIVYRIWWDGNKTWTPWIYGPWTPSDEKAKVNFTLNEECKHYIEYYAIDDLGNNESEPNWENVHNKTLFVDGSPPITLDEVANEQWYDPIANIRYVEFPTTVWLNSTDMPTGECAIGCNYTWYEVWKDSNGDNIVDILLLNEIIPSEIINSSNYPRSQVFITIPLDECNLYLIKWSSIDYLNQQEEINSRYYNCNYTGNLPPVANNDIYETYENLILSIVAPGILSNDEDADGPSTLTAYLVNNVSHGILTMYNNGSFTYKPDMGFIGIDTFTYRAFDGQDYSNVATVTINILPEISPPSVRLVPVPTITPIGIMALVVLLSLVAVIEIRRRRK